MSELLIAEPYSKSHSGFIEGQKVLAFKPQLLTMNEASIGSLMSKHEIANTKLMFEGRPFPVNQKGVPIEMDNGGVPILLTS
jgi:hypothetical protein